MQDPNADTEWNDVLRAKGIIGAKEPSADEKLEKLIDEMIEKRAMRDTLEGKSLDELDELEDDEDDRVLQQYRC